MIRTFNRIERWASESDDRATLVTILVCAAIALMALVAVGGIAWFTLTHTPPVS